MASAVLSAGIGLFVLDIDVFNISEGGRVCYRRLRLIQTVGPSSGSVIILVGSRADELGSVGQDYLQKLWDRAREVRNDMDGKVRYVSVCVVIEAISDLCLSESKGN